VFLQKSFIQYLSSVSLTVSSVPCFFSTLGLCQHAIRKKQILSLPKQTLTFARSPNAIFKPIYRQQTHSHAPTVVPSFKTTPKARLKPRGVLLFLADLQKFEDTIAKPRQTSLSSFSRVPGGLMISLRYSAALLTARDTSWSS
jgi:hypothetical protein